MKRGQGRVRRRPRSALQVAGADTACPRLPRARGPAACEGYGHVLHTVLGAQRSDGLCGPSVRPLAALLLLMAHGDLDATEHFGREDRSDTAQAEK